MLGGKVEKGKKKDKTKTMKKLMIGAAVAAMAMGASAGVCDEGSTTSPCKAWDLKMTLKSLGPKKITCKGTCSDGEVYYMDNATRKLKGYLWVCDYECGADYNVVLWDTKYKLSVIWAPEKGSNSAYQSIPAGDEMYVYGKKMNKVAGNIEFTGDMYNPVTRELAAGINVQAAGVNGKFVQGNSDTDCYIKSLSGNVAGSIAWVDKNEAPKTTRGLCEDVVEDPPCEELEVKLIPICEACAYCDTWCDSDSNAPELVPATGTWSMKYNKKVSKGGTPIQDLVPSYAL